MIFSMGALMVCPQVQLHRSIEHALYTTAFGQQQRVELPDGSNVTLSPQSQLRVEYSPLRREIELLRGEVLFAVQHDARKPFRVRVGTTVVEDVGTTFDVRIGSVGTTVVVSEGRVMLRSRPAQGNPPVLMAQNDEAFVSEAGAPVVTHISPQRIASLTAWTRQLVLMDDMTLAEAVSELNRYNRIQLRLRDPDVGKLRLGGTFNLRRPLVFAASLSALGCQITPDGRDVVWISGCRSGT